MDGKSGDSRFSRHGVGGPCVWRGAHATRPEPSAGSRRFHAGERQLRGR